MRRREFIGFVGGAAVTWPFSARSQPAAQVPTIGFLGPSTADTARSRVAAFSERLARLGWVDGQTVSIVYRWADGRADRFSELADELIRLRPNLIVTWGTETAVAVKKVSAAIPMVFTVVGDPVGSGLVASLSQPGGNVTGLSTQHADAAGKRLELLREVVGDLKRLSVLANIGNSGGVLELQQVEVAGRKLGIEITRLEFRRAEDIASAVQSISGRTQALYVVADALVNTNRTRINTLTLAARLPTMHGFREIVVEGGLMSYGPNFLDLFRRTADLCDKILRGVKPADIPVEQPIRFDLVINLITAKALGLAVSSSVLARADEIIE
jgi:putative tryptophan/tyrosine transport system substrate-binding protein